MASLPPLACTALSRAYSDSKLGVRRGGTDRGVVGHFAGLRDPSSMSNTYTFPSGDSYPSGQVEAEVVSNSRDKLHLTTILLAKY